MPSDIENLFLTHRARVYRWALAMCRNHADSLDMTQDVFVRLLRTAPVLVDERAEIGWLRRTVSSVVVDRWRSRVASARAIDVLQVARRGAGPGGGEPNSMPGESQETAWTVRDAIAQLSEQQRLVMIAKVFDGLTFEQVATELGIGVPTAKTHYLRGLAALRDRLQTAAADGRQTSCRERGVRHELPRISRATG